MKSLIGRKMVGFKSERDSYVNTMDVHIGEIGEVVDELRLRYSVQFEHGVWWYEKDEVMNNLVIKEPSKPKKKPTMGEDKEEFICSISGEVISEDDAVELYSSGEIVDKNLSEIVLIDSEYYNTEEDDVVFVESSGEYHHMDDTCWSEPMDEWILSDESVSEYDTDNYATSEWFSNNYYTYIEYGQASGYWVHEDYISYCTDIDNYVHNEDAHWDEDSEESYYDEDNMPGGTKSSISEYHHSPNPEDLSNRSKYRIGIEVEKRSFDGLDNRGDEVGEFDLFKGFEMDSSCGVEAITNVLALDEKDSDNEKEVFRMFEEARDIIDEEHIDSSCAGHMTISVGGISQSTDLLEKVRINSSIIYSMFRRRLNNYYCCNGKDLKGTRERSVPINAKPNGTVEFRIFNKINNVEQLKLRYRLMYLLVNNAVDEHKGYNDFLLTAIPILKEMYSHNDAKVKEVIKTSYMFKDFFENGNVVEEIREYLPNYYLISEENKKIKKQNKEAINEVDTLTLAC